MITRNALVSAVVVVFAVVTARATDYTLTTGDNELTAAMNASGNRLIAVSGSVLKLTGAATDGVYTINCAITAQAGELLIDATGVTDLATLRMTKNLGSNGKGSVTFKGVSALTYGTATNPSRVSNIAWGSFATLDTELAFKDSAGVTIASPTVTFVNGVLIRKHPNCDFNIAGGALIAPYAVGSLNNKIVQVDGTPTLTADTWDLFLVVAGAVPAGTKIKSSGSLLFKAINVNAPDGETGEYKWGGHGDSPFTNDVELVSGATFVDCDRAAVNTLKGTFSGSGVLSLERSGGLTLDGEQAFDGRIDLNWDETSVNSIKFRSSTPGSETNDIRVLRGSIPAKIYCQPSGYGKTATTFTMGNLLSSDGAEPVTLYTYAQQTVSIQTLTGKLYIDGAGTVSIAKLGEAAKVYVPGGAKLIVGEKAPTAKIFLTEGPESSRAWSVSGPSGSAVAVEMVFVYPDSLGAYSMTLGGNLDLFEPLPTGCSLLTVASDAQVRLVVDPDAAAFPVQNQGGSFTVLDLGERWRSKVGLWVSAEKEITLAKDFTRISGVDREATFTKSEIGVWRDCRGENNYCLAQIRYSTEKSISTILYPIYHAKGGPDDKPYVEMLANGKSRLYLTRDGVWPTTEYLSAKHVLVVFGGQLGGGGALMAEKSGWFARTPGAANGLVKNVASTNDCVIATNGVAIVSPKTTPLTGGWQILSLAIKEKDTDIYRTLSFGGLGGVTDSVSGSGNGGQNYAEVIVFANEPTEAELGAAEAYLSAKWNLPVQPRQAGAETQVSIQGGDGTYVFNANATLTGHYKGTLDLNGQKVTLPSGSLPYTEAEIPSSGRQLWIDPSLDGAMVLDEDPDHPAFANDVAGIKPRDANGVVETKDAKCLLGVRPSVTSSYRPAYVASAKAYGAARGWIDYDNDHAGDTTGNTLMLSTLPISTNYVGLVEAKAVEPTFRTLFLVLDSSRGGGSTYLSRAGGTDGTLRHRGKTPTTSDPIWSESCSDNIKNGATWLDGVSVNGAADGFTGKPEVLSAVSTANVTAKALGYYIYSASPQECFAETLLYSTAVGDADRAGIESYLMLKWLDELPAGYADFRQATVTGAGTLVVPSLKYLPQLGAGFAGSVELGGFTEAFVINGAGAAQNAVMFETYAPKLVNATVDVKVTKSANGAHLVASGVAEGSTVTLGNVTGFASERVRARVEGDKVYVDLIPRGMVFIVK